MPPTMEDETAVATRFELPGAASLAHEEDVGWIAGFGRGG